MRGQPIVLLVALCAAFASGCCLCPRVYRIGEAALAPPSPPPSASFGVLFVPSGFTRKDLPAFRVATDELARRVPAESPFGPETAAGREEIRVEFFRIDLVGRHPRRNCESAHALRSPAPSRPVPRGSPLDATRRRASSLPVDLRAEQVACDEVSIGFVGEAAALRLARCVPGVDVVVIVVNVDGMVGHTRQVAGTGDIGLAMIGIHLTDSADERDHGTGEFVSSDAIGQLQHELGHTLGLLDEYYCDPTDPLCDEADWPSEAQFRSGRNVWRENRSSEPVACDFDRVLDGGNDLTTVRWASGCSLYEYCCQVVDGQVVVTPECLGNQDSSGQLALTPACPDSGSHCELWEGAFYRKQGYFRSHQCCQMAEVGMPFCPVCHDLLTAALLSYSRTPPATGQETRP